MSRNFARKVDQQIAFVRNTIVTADQLSSGFARAGLLQAAYLQMELALAFYLAEIAARQMPKTKTEALEFIDAGKIDALLEQCQMDLRGREIKALLDVPSSWLCKFNRQRCGYHRVEQQKAIQGAFFQTEESGAGSSDLIGSVNLDRVSDQPDFAELKVIVEAMGDLVARQRVVDEEY